jgi:hypothetical protein
MESNVGKTERLIRVSGGFALISAGAFLGNLWALSGILMMLTAFIGWCPVSEVLGVSTCRFPAKIPADTRGQIPNRLV